MASIMDEEELDRRYNEYKKQFDAWKEAHKWASFFQFCS